MEPPDDRSPGAMELSPDRPVDVPLALLEVRMIEAHYAWIKILRRLRWAGDADERKALGRAHLAYQDAVAALCVGVNLSALFHQIKALIADTTQKNLDPAAEAAKAGVAFSLQTDWLAAQAFRRAPPPLRKCWRTRLLRRGILPGERSDGDGFQRR